MPTVKNSKLWLLKNLIFEYKFYKFSDFFHFPSSKTSKNIFVQSL